jgi:uncharacterized membrane protein YagU involved in acid resistance
MNLKARVLINEAAKMIKWRYRLLAIVAGNVGALAWFIAIRPLWPVKFDLEGTGATLLLFMTASAPPALWLMTMLSKHTLPSFFISTLWGVSVGLFTYFAITWLFCVIFGMPFIAAIDLFPTVGVGDGAPAGAIAGLSARAVLGRFKPIGTEVKRARLLDLLL